MSVQTKPSIVFAHGLWADGSCFNKVITALQAEGHEVVSAQNSLDTLKGDVVAVIRALDGSAARPSWSATRTAEPSSRPLDPTTALPGSSTSPRSLRTRTKRRRASRTSSPGRTSSPTSKSRTGACGCAGTASSTSREISPSRSRRSSGQPKVCRPSICSTRRWKAPPGGRSRPGTSWARTTTPFIPSCSASSRSGWAPASMRPTAATCPCSRSPPS